MNFNDKKLRKEVNDLEHRVQSIENANKGYVSKVQIEQILEENKELVGIVGALLEYLEVYPTRELVADTRYLPVQNPMAEVFRIKPNKVKKSN